MTIEAPRGLLAALLLATAACAGAPAATTSPPPAATTPAATTPTATEPTGGDAAAVARARADSARHPYTTADVRFMQDMIGHHAQALVMARLAPTHGASPDILTLAGRIVNAQQDEIRLMQTWLRDRLQEVPRPDTTLAGQLAPAGGAHDAHARHGAGHDMATMPGMLSPEQFRQLDAARGAEFDLLFLRLMIQHHRGATAMVDALFGTDGAAQDEGVFRLATDVNVDQVTEIARMERMLADRLRGGGPR